MLTSVYIDTNASGHSVDFTRTLYRELAIATPQKRPQETVELPGALSKAILPATVTPGL